MTQENMDIRDNVLQIRAGSKSVGKGKNPDEFAMISPYKEGGLVMRLLREVWFRGHLPFREWWYNKEVFDFQGEYLLVYDPLVTEHYIRWLQKQNRWTIKWFYGNLVGRAKHIHPDKVPAGIEMWTYDDNDSRKYGMNYCTKSGYNPACCYEKQEPEYDVMFVGKDKGRGEFIFRLEKMLNDAGLRTYFKVMPETRLDTQKDPRYSEPMPYDEICRIVAKSRAILNVGLPGQEGVTIRDSESIWNNVKLITTNRKTMERNFYKPSNILVIDEETVCAQQILEFLDLPFETYSPELQNEFTVRAWIREITQGK